MMNSNKKKLFAVVYPKPEQEINQISWRDFEHHICSSEADAQEFIEELIYETHIGMIIEVEYDVRFVRYVAGKRKDEVINLDFEIADDDEHQKYRR